MIQLLPIRFTASIACILLALATATGSLAAQDRFDSVAVLRAAIRDYTRDGLYEIRIAVDRRATGPEWPGARSVTWASQRSTAVQEELIGTRLGTRGIIGSVNVDSQPRRCVSTVVAGRQGDLCGFRDFEMIIALSAPLFRGDSATVFLTAWNSPRIPRPGRVREVSQEVMLYVFRRTGESWAMVVRSRVRGS
jgi:hypothetical protein